jgi:hypothetical protein
VEVNKKATKDEVAYVDIEASNGLNSGNSSTSGPSVIQEWGNYSCGGSYTAYNALNQVIYSWL